MKIVLFLMLKWMKKINTKKIPKKMILKYYTMKIYLKTLISIRKNMRLYLLIRISDSLMRYYVPL